MADFLAPIRVEAIKGFTRTTGFPGMLAIARLPQAKLRFGHDYDQSGMSMSSIEKLGSIQYALTEALVRIDAIGTATSPADVIFRFGAATSYIAAAAELKALAEASRSELLDLADKLYNQHPLATGTSEDFDV
jgi:hypothetical protein